MNFRKLPMSRLAVACVLVGGLVAAGLTSPRSHAEPAAAAAAPATKPAAAGADQPSAREDAAKAIDEALLQRLYRFDIAASGVDRPNYLRRLTYDLAGRPQTKEEVRVFLADGSAATGAAGSVHQVADRGRPHDRPRRDPAGGRAGQLDKRQ